jgi:hypothetical protein
MLTLPNMTEDAIAQLSSKHGIKTLPQLVNRAHRDPGAVRKLLTDVLGSTRAVDDIIRVGLLRACVCSCVNRVLRQCACQSLCYVSKTPH